jgi:hypothetical protein
LFNPILFAGISEDISIHSPHSTVLNTGSEGDFVGFGVCQRRGRFQQCQHDIEHTPRYNVSGSASVGKSLSSEAGDRADREESGGHATAAAAEFPGEDERSASVAAAAVTAAVFFYQKI